MVVINGTINHWNLSSNKLSTINRGTFIKRKRYYKQCLGKKRNRDVSDRDDEWIYFTVMSVNVILCGRQQLFELGVTKWVSLNYLVIKYN